MTFMNSRCVLAMLTSQSSASWSPAAYRRESSWLASFLTILSFQVSDWFTKGSSMTIFLSSTATPEKRETKIGTPAPAAIKASIPKRGESSFKGDRKIFVFLICIFSLSMSAGQLVWNENPVDCNFISFLMFSKWSFHPLVSSSLAASKFKVVLTSWQLRILSDAPATDSTAKSKSRPLIIRSFLSPHMRLTTFIAWHFFSQSWLRDRSSTG